MAHHLGDAARQENPDGRVIGRPIRQHVHKTGRRQVHPMPVLDGRLSQASRMGDRRHVQEEVGRPAKCRVNGHRVVNRVIGKDVARTEGARLQRSERASRSACRIDPDRLPGRRER
jgi:hypothetical protein